MSHDKMDFRSLRTRLAKEDFAIHPEGPEPPPQDIVSEDVWNELVWLTDDVSFRTSDNFGTELKAMNELSGFVIEISLIQRDAWFHAVLDVFDALRASLFNSLCGFYRVAASSLRAATETITVGLYLQIDKTEKDAVLWQQGKLELRFGSVCDRLASNPRMQPLESHLQKTTHQTIFAQRTSRFRTGWARGLFSELSNFSHARPTHSEASLWEGSNGPIFVPASFGRVYAHYLDVCFLFLISAKIARPDLEVPSCAHWLFDSKHVRSSDFARATFRFVFGSLP